MRDIIVRHGSISIDLKCRVVIDDARIILRSIDIIAFVEKLCIVFEYEKTMSETLGDEKLLFILGR
jgi:hypothetical protein